MVVILKLFGALSMIVGVLTGLIAVPVFLNTNFEEAFPLLAFSVGCLISGAALSGFGSVVADIAAIRRSLENRP